MFLLCDHDGVLVDTEKYYFAATKECLQSLGVQLDQETYLRFMAQGRSCWDLAVANGVSNVTLSRARIDRDRRYQELLATERVEVDGIEEVLAELSSQHRMAIVSTSKRADFDLIHNNRSICRFFEFVINIEDCEQPKPAPDPYLRALDRFSAIPSEALAIEDSSRGLTSALSAGLRCVIIRNSFTASQNFAGAWRILDSMTQLPALLADLPER